MVHHSLFLPLDAKAGHYPSEALDTALLGKPQTLREYGQSGLLKVTKGNEVRQVASVAS
jgi:hypothetical protein